MSISRESLEKAKKQAFSWFQKNEKNVIFALALILVSVLSFELGSLTVANRAGGALVIEKPAVSLAQIKKDAGMAEEGRVAGVADTAESKKQQGTSDKGDGSGIKTEGQTQCMFVGSKNSTKYHSPSCSYAKRIKPANVVCFKSKEDAEGRGYTAGCMQ